MDQEQRAEIVRLTQEYGGAWGINHTLRLLRLIEMIADGCPYDQEIVWIAAHLHDWGGYPAWAQAGVDHAVRSKQVAQQFLPDRGFTPYEIDRILDCIEFHHQAGSDRRIESILLRDADALDFLGVVGALRDFSKNEKDLRKAYDISKKRREKLPGILFLEKSKEIAAERIRQMDALFANFEQDTWGYY